MSVIRPLIRNTSFNPEALEAMVTAYERAKLEIHTHDSGTNEALAMRIITLAAFGVLDAERLSNAAVKGFAVSRT